MNSASGKKAAKGRAQKPPKVCAILDMSWEAKFEEWNDDEDHRVSLCQECWYDGFMMYPHVFGHESD